MRWQELKTVCNKLHNLPRSRQNVYLLSIYLVLISVKKCYQILPILHASSVKNVNDTSITCFEILKVNVDQSPGIVYRV